MVPSSKKLSLIFLEEGGVQKSRNPLPKKSSLKFWKNPDEEKSTPGVGNIAKVRQSEGISSSKKIGPTLWKRGGGPEILESSSKKSGLKFWSFREGRKC